MIPAEFEYHSPKNLDEALRLLARHGDEAKVLAGGHSLLPLMKLRLASPRFIVDLGRIRNMNYVREADGRIAIGALTTHAEIAASDLLRRKCPVLAETAAEIGDVQVRNRGTLGGSLAHADPAADYPATILALDAEIRAVSSGGERILAARDFFVEMLSTQLRPGELLTEVRIAPLDKRTGAAYVKLRQPASGYAVVGVAAVVTLNGAGKAESVAVGVTGVAPKAYRAEAVEKALKGKQLTPQLIESAARRAAAGADALSDIHASAEYRREIAAVIARRALVRAFDRARR
jgi:carbon-monoxide dehydrogenase medium subunit